ncbi:uncharacterized protein LOC135195023 [Macrobrachium nipponense]|uniref:uncharacterized protein LOC135195023 n=1 Tax=Macrobrachium nipponense TaxID=159736 RepID=UPI0030C7C201
MDLTCRNNLLQNFRSPSCYTHDNAFCFYTLNDSNSQSTMIITTNNTNNISENEKLVYILKNLVDFKWNKWCEHPLNYTKQFRIIHNVYQTYYFCYGNPDNTYAKDSWIIKDITDKESLVAINGNVNAANIDSNILLQALIFTNNNINATIYDALSTSNYIFKHHTDEFNIAVFEAKQSQPDVLDYIMPEKCIITKNKYFNKLTDTRSISSPLNYIAFHNCSLNYKKDDKDLFLFLYNGSSNLEYICSNNTAVILTSIRRENVNFLNSTKFARSCFDGGIHTKNSEVCEYMTEGASDYETQFFHFLIYPLKLTKASAIQQLAQRFKRPNKIETFNVNFEFNTHPAILGGFTILHQNDTYSSGIDYINEMHIQSLQKTLQIFVTANLTNNTRCLEDIEVGKFSVSIHSDEQQRSHYVIGPISSNIFNESCLRILPFDIHKDLLKSKDKGLLRVNKFWPTCQYNMLIAWNEKANDTTSVLDWDYLSTACKAHELTLFILCCVLTLMSITGNTMGISILILSKLIKKNVFKVYMSLAMAGLILSIMSALLALFDTYLLMSGQHTFNNLREAHSSSLATEQTTGIQQAVLQRAGWSTVTSVAMNISLMSSLMSLALLGILALQQTSSFDGHDIKPNRMSKFFNFIDHHISFIILIIWIWSIIFPIIINLEEGSFTGYFDPVTKLTINTGSNRTLSSITYKVQLVMGFIAVATITTTLSYITYKSKSEEQEALIAQQGETAQVIIRTFFKMVILVLVSCGPVAVNILSNFFVFNPVLHFLIWWLYITGSSGHWVIFCFSGQCSREIKKRLGRVFFPMKTHQEEIHLS